MTELRELDHALADLLARRAAALAAGGAPSLDEQLDADAPGGEVPPALWRAMVAGTAAAARARALPPYTHAPRRVVIVGGGGAMGRRLGAELTGLGHGVASLDVDGWPDAAAQLGGADACLVAVPIDATERAIRDAAGHLAPGALLADITSLKAGPVAAMLDAHAGPVLGLHPMFGPDVGSLQAQRIVACPAREPGAGAWLLDVFRAAGATIVESTPEEHDRMMVAVQAIRHFSTLALGVFLADEGIDVPRSLEFASPIYRLEIDIVSRLFAQSPELYLSIMSASPERTGAIGRLAETFGRLAGALAGGDHDVIRSAFDSTSGRLGAEAPRALAETALAVEALSTALAARG
jgi:prephenate dehydrogenase